jgi:transposase
MLHAGLDLSRRKVDVCLLNDHGEQLDQLAVAPDLDSLRTLARRVDDVHAEPVCAVVESMTGARLVHDTLEQEGWDVEIADAQKVKGLAPLACKTDKIDSMVLAVLSHRDLVPAIWLPDPRVREERELARFRMHLVKHKSALKNRVHSTMINFGRPCPVTDLIGAEGRRLLARLDVPEPWRGNVTASVELIDVYRPLPARQPVGRQGPPRAVDQAWADLPALGAARGDDACASPPRLRRALPAHEEAARQAARREGRSG